MRPLIQVRNLSKYYRVDRLTGVKPTLREALANTFKRSLGRTNGHRIKLCELLSALQDVSFEVNSGEVLGIIGRNGAGKSTLLKILARIINPSAGEVDIYGRVGSLLEIGTGFHPDLTGRENVYLNASIIGMNRDEIRSKFDEIVAFAEAEQFLDQPVKHYSSGMYLRLAFAIAVHFESEVLILDEVLAVGDAAFQKKCLQKMREVSRRGHTVLIASHDLSSVQQLCSRVLFIESGRIFRDGKPEVVIPEYLQLISASVG